MSDRAYIYTLVNVERDAQERKWGQQDHPFVRPGHHPPDVTRWLRIPTAFDAKLNTDRDAEEGLLTYSQIVLEEFCETVEAAALDDVEATKVELIQTIACLVAAYESLERNGR